MAGVRRIAGREVYSRLSPNCSHSATPDTPSDSAFFVCIDEYESRNVTRCLGLSCAVCCAVDGPANDEFDAKSKWSLC